MQPHFVGLFGIVFSWENPALDSLAKTKLQSPELPTKLMACWTGFALVKVFEHLIHCLQLFPFETSDLRPVLITHFNNKTHN